MYHKRALCSKEKGIFSDLTLLISSKILQNSRCYSQIMLFQLKFEIVLGNSRGLQASFKDEMHISKKSNFSLQSTTRVHFCFSYEKHILRNELWWQNQEL